MLLGGVWTCRWKNNMNIELWMMAVALPAAMLATWGLCRWFYVRRIREADRRLSHLDASYQASLKLQMQARKQVEELQRIVSEYRRRLTTAELARRSPLAPKMAPREPFPEPVLEATPDDEPVRKAPVTWADTQPM
jgi:hypothetical protein